MKKKSQRRASADNRCGIGADHRVELSRLNRIRGQLDGIGRMIDQNAYCPEIIIQVQAARASLASLQGSLLNAHLHDCVKRGLRSGNETESNRLLDELSGIFKRS